MLYRTKEVVVSERMNGKVQDRVPSLVQKVRVPAGVAYSLSDVWARTTVETEEPADVMNVFVSLRPVYIGSMAESLKETLLGVISEYKALGIDEQEDYGKFFLYSIVTHSTAIEGSTVTEIENQLLFDEGTTAKGRTLVEQMMNLDLKAAYEKSIMLSKAHTRFTVNMLKGLSAIVMKNTGSVYNTLQGSFDSSKGDLRLINVTAGYGGRSYMNYLKVPFSLEAFCDFVNGSRQTLLRSDDIYEQYCLSFDAHNILVSIHPWVDGNGRMARLVMNHLQFEFGLIPSKVLKEDRLDYIQALINSRDQDTPEPFRTFMLESHIRNLRNEITTFIRSSSHDPLRGRI